MSQTTKATLYLKQDLYRAVKIRAAETGQSASELVNEAIASQVAEDMADIKSIQKRKNQPTESYESFLKNLKKDGLI